MLPSDLIYIWLVLMVVFVVIEALTVQMLCIWFALAALAALIACALSASAAVQIAVFIGAAALLLVLTRPLVRRLQKSPRVRTNADRVLGESAVVTQEINNDSAVGQVMVNGQIWSARSDSGAVIAAGERVVVRRIEGVKVIVGQLVTAQSE